MARAYRETTIPSYCVARPSNSPSLAARQTSTRKWWDSGCSGFDLTTSLETLDEVAKGDQSLAAARLHLLDDIQPLRMTDEAIKLASELVARGLIPAKAASDSIHIAIASAHAIDYLVTWNFKHIASPFLRERLQKAV